MVLSLLAAHLLIQDGSIFAKWFPQPTGNNGLEEYARAADMLSTPEFLAFESWQPRDPYPLDVTPHKQAVPALRASKPDPRVAEFGQRIANLDYADVCALEASRFGQVLTLVRQGNGKGLLPPSAPLDAGTLTFDLRFFFDRFANLSARVEQADFAKGQTGAGLQVLCDQIDLYDQWQKISVTSGINVPFAIENLALSAASHLGQLDQSDCNKAHTFLSARLESREWVREQLKVRLAFWDARIEDFVKKNSSPYTGERTPAPEGMIDDFKLNDEISKMTDAQRRTLVEAAEGKASSVIAQLQTFLDAPESKWFDGELHSPYFKLNGITNDDDLISRLAKKNMGGAILTVFKLDAKARERLRLFDVHCQILAFRWKHGRLPITLEEVAKGLSTDPLNDGTFKYSIRAPGDYDLFSDGNSFTGQLRLRPDPPAPPRPLSGHPQEPRHPRFVQILTVTAFLDSAG